MDDRHQPPALDGLGPAPACIPNIGPRERRKRMASGLVTFAIAAGLTVLLVALRADRLWRLVLLLPFWAGAVGVLQATGKT